MKTIQIDYAVWFAELEFKLALAEITYLPSHFYGLIKWYYHNGYSADFTAQVIQLHISIVNGKM